LTKTEAPETKAEGKFKEIAEAYEVLSERKLMTNLARRV